MISTYEESKNPNYNLQEILESIEEAEVDLANRLFFNQFKTQNPHLVVASDIVLLDHKHWLNPSRYEAAIFSLYSLLGNINPLTVSHIPVVSLIKESAKFLEYFLPIYQSYYISLAQKIHEQTESQKQELLVIITDEEQMSRFQKAIITNKGLAEEFIENFFCSNQSTDNITKFLQNVELSTNGQLPDESNYVFQREYKNLIRVRLQYKEALLQYKRKEFDRIYSNYFFENN